MTICGVMGDNSFEMLADSHEDPAWEYYDTREGSFTGCRTVMLDGLQNSWEIILYVTDAEGAHGQSVPLILTGEDLD